MGILNSIFGGRQPPTKMKISGLAASAVDYVIRDAGLKGLLAGSLVLDKELGVSFRGGRHVANGSIIATVAIADLDESEILKSLVSRDIRDTSMLQPVVDQLIYAVIREFEAQSATFAGLQAGSYF